MRRAARYLMTLCVVAVASCRAADAPADARRRRLTERKGGRSMAFTLMSDAFEAGGGIPAKYTGDGEDISPPLRWEGVPEGTAAFVLICDDPDAPVGNWVHWVLFDLPGDLRSLPPDVPRTGSVLGSAGQGVNDFRNIGYGGPAPPPGKAHRYIFTLYALDQPCGIKPGASKADVLRRVEGHILGKAELTGTYRR